MGISNFKPHKITKPIQLLGVWFLALVVIDWALLNGAESITSPSWVTPMLSIAAVIFVPIFLILAFVMQTKYRTHLQDDPYYSDWLKETTSKEKPRGSEDRVPKIVTNENTREIKCGLKSEKIVFSSDAEINLLYLKARINFSHEAGSANLIRLMVNNEFLKANDLINKPPVKRYIDGRENFWFDQTNNSWSLSFSPSFKDNYFHKRYKVITGDPYIFIFDLSNIPKKDNNKYEIEIEHIGSIHGHDAQKNSVIIQDLCVY